MSEPIDFSPIINNNPPDFFYVWALGIRHGPFPLDRTSVRLYEHRCYEPECETCKRGIE